MNTQSVVVANAQSGNNGTPDKVCYTFSSWMGYTKSVILDRSENTISFENCFAPRKWFTSKVSQFQCSLDDIVVAYAYGNRIDKMLKIVTVQGTAEISSRNSTGFTELSDALSSYSVPNRLDYPLENPALAPLLGLIFFGGAVVGLVVALCFVSRAAGVGTVALALMCGGVCGMLATKLLIHYVYSRWRIELIKPLGYGVLLAALALFVGVKLGPNVAWDWRIAFLPIPLAFLVGVIFGTMLNRRRVVGAAK